MTDKQSVPSGNTMSGSSSTTEDVELGPDESEADVRIEGGGYDELAEFMSIHSGAAIFRRFMKWYIRRLLFLQAELTGLEKEVMHWAQEDRDSADPHRQLYHRDYWEFSRCQTKSQVKDQNDKQWKTWTKMNLLLKEYAETSRYIASMNEMPEIDRGNIRFLQKWMSDHGNVVLTGVEWNQWETTSKDDLMALNGRAYEDQLTKHVEKRLVPWYNHVLGRWYKKPIPAGSALAGLFKYDVHKIGRVISIAIISLATALPIGAIAVLSLPLSNQVRLGLMAAFTFSFSLCLGSLSGAKKTEVFAASAAFAAVQVVFVSGNPSCPTT